MSSTERPSLFALKGPGNQMDNINDLIHVIQHEVDLARTAAEELRQARSDNARYLEAIRERDALIREYIETIQILRSKAAGSGTSS